MKIYIAGATGFMGSHFTEHYQNNGDTVLTDRIDITDKKALENYITKHQPDVILNCAGVTGTPNVDWCESHKELTYQVNVNGAINLATIAKENNIFFAHLGSGCIYVNPDEFTEEDPANFAGSCYSRTKTISEKALDDLDALQLRIRIPISGTPSRKNVIDKLVKYEKIISVENSITVIEDFIPASAHLIKERATGIFNMTNIGSVSHKDIMSLYTKIVDPTKEFTYISLQELDEFIVAQRSNCTLSSDKREAHGAHMPNIKDRLPQLLEEYKKNL